MHTTTQSSSSVAYSNKLGARKRRPYLLVIRDGVITTFAGQSIPGALAVRSTSYKKDGTWSHATYDILLAPGVRALAVREHFETGSLVDGIAAATSTRIVDWSSFAAALGVTVASARAWAQATRPQIVERLDKVEAEIAEVEDAVADDSATLDVSIGGYSRRDTEGGAWLRPIVIEDANGGEIARLLPEDQKYGWQQDGFRIVPTNAPIRVLSSTHTGGPRGGHRSMRVAVPAGCVART